MREAYIRQDIDQHRPPTHLPHQRGTLLLRPGRLHKRHIRARHQRGLEAADPILECLSTGVVSAELVRVARVGAGDDYKVRVLARLDGAADALDEDLGVDDLFAFELAAAFWKYLTSITT